MLCEIIFLFPCVYIIIPVLSFINDILVAEKDGEINSGKNNLELAK